MRGEFLLIAQHYSWSYVVFRFTNPWCVPFHLGLLITLPFVSLPLSLSLHVFKNQIRGEERVSGVSLRTLDRLKVLGANFSTAFAQLVLLLRESSSG